MASRSLNDFARKLETRIIYVFIFWFLDVYIPVIPAFIGSAIKALSYPVLVILIIWRWKRFAYVATSDIFVVLLMGLMLASVNWSVIPENTSTASKGILRATLFGAYLATRYSLKEQMQLFSWMLGVAAFLSFIITLAMPSYGIHDNGAWHGIFNYKNDMACVMSIGAISSLFIAPNSGRYRWLALAGFSMEVALIALSQGKTGYAIFFILVCLLPVYKFIKQQYKLRAFLLLVGVLLSGSAIVLILNNLEFIVVDTLGKNLEFNGRLPIWNLMLDKVFERPWFGYGVASFWDSDESDYVLYNSWAGGRAEGFRFNAHNAYLDLLLSLGFVGLSLYLIGFTAIFIRTLYLLFSIQAIENFWALLTLISLSLFNLADSLSILSYNSLWTLYISIGLSTALQQNRLKIKRKSNLFINRFRILSQ